MSGASRESAPPHGPGPPVVPADERDVLVATKLMPPRPRPDWVARPRLLRRLRGVGWAELVLVCGPAGFGKSGLLADWAREHPATAWLSLDDADNDPVRFWRHVVAALDPVHPGLGARVRPLLGGPAGTAVRHAVAVLVNELAAAPGETLLVLDDYHLVTAPEVHHSVALLVERLPPALRVAVTSRADPPLPLARMRARGQLVELRAADLRFTPEECATLLRAAAGAHLSEDAVAVLSRRTEGWVAGLHLAALSLHGRDDGADVARFVRDFSGSHRFVLDYLTEEVLDRQPAALREFLLATSVLERLSGPLCDALTGDRDGQARLEEVERANLFLLPLDSSRRWWRYHHLFADLLRARLRQDDPDRWDALHRAAAGWYERHGLPDDAIRHAVAAGDRDHAARLVEAHLDEAILTRAEGATLIRWLATLPADHGRPRLALAQALLALMACRLDEVEPLLAEAEAAAGAAGGEDDYRPSVGRAYSLLGDIPGATAVWRAELARLRGDEPTARRHAREALRRLTGGDPNLLAMARYQAAGADWLAGRLAEAEHAMAEVVAERLAAAGPRIALRGSFDLGAVQQARGRLGAALVTHRRGLEVGERSGMPPPVGMALIGLAEVHYERDELAEATRHALAGVEHARLLVYPTPLVAGLIVLARIHRARGDRDAAGAALAEADAAMPRVVDLRTPLDAVRARLDLDVDPRGGPDAVITSLRGRGVRVEDPPTFAREPERLVLARALVAGGSAAAGAALARAHRELAVAQDRGAGAIAARTVEACALDAAGDRDAARAALAEALLAAAPEGHLRVFLDEGAPVAGLLRELLVGRRWERLLGVGDVPREFLTRLAGAFARDGEPVLPRARRGAVAAPGLVEPLSPREGEVLRLLAAGHANRDIAEDLVISLDTVKRHVTHVLDKLGVASRTQAVARARELGLL